METIWQRTLLLAMGLALLAAFAVSSGDTAIFAGRPSGPAAGLAMMDQIMITGRNLTNVAGLEFKVKYDPGYGDVTDVRLAGLPAVEMGFKIDTTAEKAQIVVVSPKGLPRASRLVDLQISRSTGRCAERFAQVVEYRAFDESGAELSMDPKLGMAGDVDLDGFVNGRDLQLVTRELGRQGSQT